MSTERSVEVALHGRTARPDDYRIPLVHNARRFRRGHRIRLTVTSDDTSANVHAMLLFTQTPAGENGVSSCRLLLPALR